MNFGINYYPNFHYYNEENIKYVIFKELNIDNFIAVAGFCKEHPHITPRFVASAKFFLENPSRLETAKAVKAIVAIDSEDMIFDADAMEVIEYCKSNGIRVSFHTPVTNWDMLNYVAELQLYDVTVSGEMCFDIYSVSAVCKKNNVNLNLYPNIAQSSTLQGKVTDFYIRPEDVKYYEDIVDCMLLYSVDKYTPIKTIYEIYAHDQKWADHEVYLISLLQEDFNSNNVLEPFNFGKVRLNCKKKCAKGGSCIICSMVRDFCKMVEDHNLEIEHK